MCVFMQKKSTLQIVVFTAAQAGKKKNLQHSSKSVNMQHRLQVSEYQEWDKWPFEAYKATDYFLKVSGLFYIATQPWN